jgi:hypothetical protein
MTNKEKLEYVKATLERAFDEPISLYECDKSIRYLKRLIKEENKHVRSKKLGQEKAA